MRNHGWSQVRHCRHPAQAGEAGRPSVTSLSHIRKMTLVLYPCNHRRSKIYVTDLLHSCTEPGPGASKNSCLEQAQISTFCVAFSPNRRHIDGH